MKLNFDLKSLLKRTPKGEAHVLDQDGSQAKSSESMRNAAIWVKTHLLLVVLAVVALGAMGGGTYFRIELMDALQEEAGGFGGKLGEFKKLESTQVAITIPGNAPVTASTIVSRKLLKAVKDRMGTGTSDTSQVRGTAVAHNRGSHKPLVNLRLEAKDPKRQEVHLDLVASLNAAYAALLSESLGAGSPPSDWDVTVKLQRRQFLFIQNDLKKAPDATLTDAERKQLTDGLTTNRIALYAAAADAARIFVDGEDVGMFREGFDPGTLKLNLRRLWDLQFRFWVAEDVLLACKSVNTEASVPLNPIKRILFVQSLGAVLATSTDAAAGSPSAGGEGGGEGGSEPTPPPAGIDDASATSGIPIDPNQPVAMGQYSASLKGWATNQLYDVTRTRVRMVAETSKIPMIADAFARQNFIVITDVEVQPTDAFAGLNDGCFYGEAPISIVTWTLESAWLREWTGPLMPDEVRKQLNTTGQLAGAADATGAPATQEN